MATITEQEVLYGTESTFMDEVGTANDSLTVGTKLPIVSVDSGPPAQDRQSDNQLQSRMNESAPGYLMPRTHTFEFTTYASGHVGATTGALTENWIQDLLSDGLGGGSTSVGGGTITSATSGSAFVTTGATLVPGEACRVGAKLDGRCDGQIGVVSTFDAGTTALLTALPATPNADDVVYAMQTAYPTEAPATTKRFLHGFSREGRAYAYHGCQLAGMKLNAPIGGLPTIRWRYAVGYWDVGDATLPSATAIASAKAVPVAGGSVFYNSVGTATRAILNPASIELDIDLGLAEQEGPAASQPNYCKTVGWVRTRCVPTLTLLVPRSNDYDTLYDTDGASTTHKHILVTLNVQDGASVGFYLPRAYIVGARPTYENYNGLTYQRLVFRGREGTVTTSDLTRSAIRFFIG